MSIITGFKSQAMLLSRMFYFIESGKVQNPIYSPEQAPLGTSNKDFLQEYVANLLQTAFKNLQEYVLPDHEEHMSRRKPNDWLIFSQNPNQTICCWLVCIQ